MNGRFEFDATGIYLAPSLRLDLALMFDVDVHTLNYNAIFIHKNIDDLAALAFVLKAAANNFNGIAFAYL
jgi:hypothetical protein